MEESVKVMLTEELAKIQHEIWAHWMAWQFKCGEFKDDGSFVIPPEKVKRWSRQASTPYAELSEQEKESDRIVVREFMFREFNI